MKKNNILIVLPWLPYPLISGGHQALFNGIAAISNDMEVSIAFTVTDDFEYNNAQKEFSKRFPNVRLFPYYKNKGKGSKAKASATEKPWYSRLFKRIFHPRKAKADKKGFEKINFWSLCTLPPDHKWTAHLLGIINNNSFDIIQVEMPWLLNTILGLPNNHKVIYVHHELGFIRRKLEIRNTSEDDYRTLSWFRFCNLNEIAQLNLYDAVITLSTTDKNKLEEAGITKPVYSSLAVVHPASEAGPQVCNQKRLTFIGPESHYPNYEGITWFLDNCWKELKEKNPEFTLDIIGEWSSTSIKQYKEKYTGINFLGFVDDLYEALKGSIMIVPINIGSGIRIKILEAISHGIPFISTTIGAEGIPVKNGVHCFIADAPKDFVNSILKIQDLRLQMQFIQASSKLVEESYSLEALRKNRLDIYNKILDEQTTRNNSHSYI